MNSLFTSFEAFTAESFGWKVKYSQPIRSISPPQSAAKITGEEIGTKSAAPAPVVEKSSDEDGKQRMNRNPRFAVELDGIHCFETILPY